eukprot:Lankesteria_metandrocarpae@DN5066_c0_g1_i2.p1
MSSRDRRSASVYTHSTTEGSQPFDKRQLSTSRDAPAVHTTAGSTSHVLPLQDDIDARHVQQLQTQHRQFESLSSGGHRQTGEPLFSNPHHIQPTSTPLYREDVPLSLQQSFSPFAQTPLGRGSIGEGIYNPMRLDRMLDDGGLGSRGSSSRTSGIMTSAHDLFALLQQHHSNDNNSDSDYRSGSRSGTDSNTNMNYNNRIGVADKINSPPLTAGVSEMSESMRAGLMENILPWKELLVKNTFFHFDVSSPTDAVLPPNLSMHNLPFTPAGSHRELFPLPVPATGGGSRGLLSSTSTLLSMQGVHPSSAASIVADYDSSVEQQLSLGESPDCTRGSTSSTRASPSKNIVRQLRSHASLQQIQLLNDHIHRQRLLLDPRQHIDDNGSPNAVESNAHTDYRAGFREDDRGSTGTETKLEDALQSHGQQRTSFTADHHHSTGTALRGMAAKSVLSSAASSTAPVTSASTTTAQSVREDAYEFTSSSKEGEPQMLISDASGTAIIVRRGSSNIPKVLLPAEAISNSYSRLHKQEYTNQTSKVLDEALSRELADCSKTRDDDDEMLNDVMLIQRRSTDAGPRSPLRRRTVAVTTRVLQPTTIPESAVNNYCPELSPSAYQRGSKRQREQYGTNAQYTPTTTTGSKNHKPLLNNSNKVMDADFGYSPQDSHDTSPSLDVGADKGPTRSFKEGRGREIRFVRMKTIHLMPSDEKKFENRRLLAKLEGVLYRPPNVRTSVKAAVRSPVHTTHTTASPTRNPNLDVIDRYSKLSPYPPTPTPVHGQHLHSTFGFDAAVEGTVFGHNEDQKLDSALMHHFLPTTLGGVHDITSTSGPSFPSLVGRGGIPYLFSPVPLPIQSTSVTNPLSNHLYGVHHPQSLYLSLPPVMDEANAASSFALSLTNSPQLSLTPDPSTGLQPHYPTTHQPNTFVLPPSMPHHYTMAAVAARGLMDMDPASARVPQYYQQQHTQPSAFSSSVAASHRSAHHYLSAANRDTPPQQQHHEHQQHHQQQQHQQQQHQQHQHQQHHQQHQQQQPQYYQQQRAPSKAGGLSTLESALQSVSAHRPSSSSSNAAQVVMGTNMLSSGKVQHISSSSAISDVGTTAQHGYRQLHSSNVTGTTSTVAVVGVATSGLVVNSGSNTEVRHMSTGLWSPPLESVNSCATNPLELKSFSSALQDANKFGMPFALQMSADDAIMPPPRALSTADYPSKSRQNLDIDRNTIHSTSGDDEVDDDMTASGNQLTAKDLLLESMAVIASHTAAAAFASPVLGIDTTKNMHIGGTGAQDFSLYNVAHSPMVTSSRSDRSATVLSLVDATVLDIASLNSTFPAGIDPPAVPTFLDTERQGSPLSSSDHSLHLQQQQLAIADSELLADCTALGKYSPATSVSAAASGSPSSATASPDVSEIHYGGYSSSVGAALHPLGCKPCAFMWTKGCVNGRRCQFCHEWHLPKKKKPMKDQKNLMIIARPDGKIEFLRCTIDEALRVCY